MEVLAAGLGLSIYRSGSHVGGKSLREWLAKVLGYSKVSGVFRELVSGGGASGEPLQYRWKRWRLGRVVFSNRKSQRPLDNLELNFPGVPEQVFRYEWVLVKCL